MIKSIERCDQGHWVMDKGCSSPEGSSLGVLDWAQTGQDLTYLATSLVIDGHQNEFCVRWRVLEIPGWPEQSDVWTHCMTLAQRFSGTQCMLGGQPCGAGSFCCSLWISSIRSHVTARCNDN